MAARLRSTFVLSLLASLGLSCLPGGRLPPPLPPGKRGSTLAPGRDAEAADVKLVVAFSSPSGDNLGAPQPTLVFSRPVHRLGDPPDEPRVVASISPPVEGRWIWVGSTALTFAPKERFRLATPYTIDIAPGLRSLDGQVIDAPTRLAFSTAALKLDDVSGGSGKADPISLSFSHDVEPDALRKALRVTTSGGKPVAFALGKGTTTGRHFELFPAREWPEGVGIRVRVDGSLRGVEGPLGLGREVVEALRDPEPTRIESIRCSWQREHERCEEESPLDIDVSSAIKLATLRPLVSISPPIPFQIVPAWGSAREPQTRFEIKAKFKAGKDYKVVIKASPDRQRGERVDAGAERSLGFVPPGGSVWLLASGTYMLPSWRGEVWAGAERTERVEVGAAVLDPETAFLHERGRLDDGALRKLFPKKTAIVEAAQAGRKGVNFRVDGLLPPEPGPLLIETSWKDGEGEHAKQRMLQRTDLGLSIRQSQEGTLVWVTRLSTGKPVAGADVEVRDWFDHKATGKTDAQGVALVETKGMGAAPGKGDGKRDPDERQFFVSARHGDDWMFSRATDHHRGARYDGSLFVERGIYRPGDKVYLKGVVRKPTTQGLVPPEGEVVQLRYWLPDGRPRSQAEKLSAWGTFSREIELPRDVPLGRMRFQIEHEGRTLASVGAEVGEFRTLSFNVDASLDRAHYQLGDEVTCTGSAAYLYGGSMAGAKSVMSVERSPASFTVPGLGGYLIGDADRRHAQLTVAERRESLDRRGRQVMTAKLEHTRQLGPEQLTCEVAVADASNQVVRAVAAAMLHPAEFYVAVDPGSRGFSIAPGDRIKPRVLAVTPEGARRVASVTLTLRHLPPRTATGVPEASEPLASCSLGTGDDPASCELRLPPGSPAEGAYRLEASATDARGRVALTTARLWAHKPAPPPPPPAPVKPAKKPAEPTEPSLESDANEYKIGDRARLTLTPRGSFTSALLLAEREGIASHRFLDGIERPVSFEWPVDRAMAPRMFFEAVLINPVGEKKVMRQASRAVAVKPPSRRLDVRLRPSKTAAQPGDVIDVEVDVSGAEGALVPAEVTLYAVDEGTLQLTGYKTPTIEGDIELNGEHLVSGRETRSALAHFYRPTRGGTGSGFGYGSGSGRAPQVRMGATSVSEREQPRVDFRQTPLFLPSLETDDKGHARASFKLPDSLTAYRLMAVAIGKGDLYGSSEVTLTTSKPTQIRPVLPRVVRAGDRFEALAMVANNEPRPRAIEATLQADGLDVQNPRARVELGPGETQRVSFPVEARRVGAATMTFRSVASEGASDSAIYPVEVQSPARLEASAVYGATDARVDEAIADLARVRPDVGSLELTLSASPVAGLAPGLEQLVEYPYGCTEQTVSRLVPLVSLRDLAKALSVQLPPDVDEVARSSVGRLLGHQQAGGGFGLWPESSPSPWISAYAIWGLSEAHRRGMKVNEEVFQKAFPHLSEVALRWPKGKVEAAEACFALDVLAEMPSLDETQRGHLAILAAQLFQRRAELPLFARALLLHSMVLYGLPRADVDALVADVQGALHRDGPAARAVAADESYAELLDSTPRTSALALRALLLAAPASPLLTPLALGLVADRGPGGWRTTHEAAWALIALDAYRRAAQPGPVALDALVLLGPKTLVETSFRADGAGIPPEQTRRLPLSELLGAGPADLSFVARGQGKLHYQARLRYAPAQPPSTPLFAGMEVSRRCHALSDDRGADLDPLPATRFKVGSWVRCEIDVVTPTPRRFVAVDDPLPGGFEAVNLSLRGGPGWLRRHAHGSSTRRELRDDRVVFFIDRLAAGAHRWSYVARATTVGSFVLPPSRAEEMYAPEVHGRTEAGQIVVEP